MSLAMCVLESVLCMFFTFLSVVPSTGGSLCMVARGEMFCAYRGICVSVDGVEVTGGALSSSVGECPSLRGFHVVSCVLTLFSSPVSSCFRLKS